jgi:hypothetical protein
MHEILQNTAFLLVLPHRHGVKMHKGAKKHRGVKKHRAA